MSPRIAFAAAALAALSGCDVPQTSQQSALLDGRPASTQATEGDITLANAAQILAYEIDRMPDDGLGQRIALVGARAEGTMLIVDISHPFTSVPPSFSLDVLGQVHGRLMCRVGIMQSFVQLGGVVEMNLQYSNGRTFYTQQVTGC